MQTEKKQQKYQQKVNEDTPKFPVSRDEHPIYARKEFTKCKQKKKEEKNVLMNCCFGQENNQTCGRNFPGGGKG